MSSDDRPLPPGWIREHDPASNHSFWVDTKVNPPRSIWTHPLDDPQFIAEHPEYQRLDVKSGQKYDPPSSPRPVSWDERKGQASSSRKRGFFGKLKDKAIGTKEEREAEKRRVEALREQHRQQMLLQQQQYQLQQQQFYHQNPGYVNPSGFNAPVYAPPRSGGGFGGGAALPLLGGLAGGLLLGEALDGFGGDGGDFGGGDFGGGDFGGGDF